MKPRLINYDNYFDHSREDVENMKWDLGAHITRRAVREFMTAAAGYLLEIGPGYGHFVNELPDAFTQVHIVDISPVTIASALSRIQRPVQSHVGALETLGLPAEHFDVIASAHVIEHIEDDFGFLRECMRLLKPGGEIVMLTPGRLSGIAPPNEVETMGHFRSYNRRRIEYLAAGLPGAKVEGIAFVHQILARVWPRIAWFFHAANYPFRWFILRDDRSAFERRLYQKLLPFLEDILNWIDRLLWDREGVLEPYNVLFRIRKTKQQQHSE